MKVGRAALDEEAIRLLEELNPDVEFDWTRILKADAGPPPEPRPQAPQKRAERPRRGSAGQPAAAGPRDSEPDRDEAIEDLESRSAIDIPIPADAAQEIAPPSDLPPSLSPAAAEARLGTEGVIRLRGRYAEILARINERIPDPVRREELKAQADRLNPDTWVTDDEVRAGLEQYESVFEGLRALVGRRRRRRRRRGGAPSAAAPAAEPGSDAHGTEGEDTEDSEGPEEL